MVQMKAMFVSCSTEKIDSLYIPHGSDESGRNPKDITTPEFLYIPHGSDESYEQLTLANN